MGLQSKKTVGENDARFSTRSIRNNISQTVSNTATVNNNHQQEIAYRWFVVDFFARGLYTLIAVAVALLPLRQMGFLVSEQMDVTKFGWLFRPLQLQCGIILCRKLYIALPSRLGNWGRELR